MRPVMMEEQEDASLLAKESKLTILALEEVSRLLQFVHASLGILSNQIRLARSFVVMEKLGQERLVTMEVLEDAQRLVLRLVQTINVLEAQSLQPRLAHA
jgi:hypothetical protein